MGLHSDLDHRRRQLLRMLRTDYPALEAEFCKSLGITDADVPPNLRGEELVEIILNREFPRRRNDADD